MPRHPVRMLASGIGLAGLVLAGVASAPRPAADAADAAPGTPPVTSATVTSAAFPAPGPGAGPGAGSGWALGTAGGSTRIWHTGTGGASWQQQWQGSGTPLGLTAADPDHAWALLACAGTGGRKPACGRELLGTAGRGWRVLATLPAAVNEVSFASPRLGVAIADGCLANPGLQRCPGQVLVSHDGGATWTTVLTEPGPVFAAASAAGRLWAAQILPGVQQGPDVRFLTSADGGRSWQRSGQLTAVPPLSPQARINLAVSPATRAGPASLAWISVFDLFSCAMHGCSAGLFGSTDGGQTWRPAGLPDAYPDECGPASIELSMAPDGTPWAATGRNGAACAPPLGPLYRHGQGGWQELPPWQLTEVTSLTAVSQQTAYAIGDSGALSRTTDGGQHWTQVLPAPVPAQTGELAVTGPQTALAAQDANDSGAILRSADGGGTWQQLASLPGIVTALNVPAGGLPLAAVTYTAGGGHPARQLWTSADGGGTWRPGGPLPGADASDGTIEGPWMSADGHGLLLAVTDGTPWAPQNGGSAPVREWTTSDGGLTWTGGTRLPLGGDSLNGPASFTYLGSGAWSGWLAVTTASFKTQVLSVTGNGAALVPLPGAPPADGLQLTAPGTGFAWGIGYTRTQVLTLYRTTDGGRTWQRSGFTLPAGADATPLLGFSDASHGWLLAGTFRWHTSDGGQTWQPLSG